jgi:hypothetical protein
MSRHPKAVGLLPLRNVILLQLILISAITTLVSCEERSTHHKHHHKHHHDHHEEEKTTERLIPPLTQYIDPALPEQTAVECATEELYKWKAALLGYRDDEDAVSG